MAKFGVRLEPEDRERVVTFDGGGWATFGRFSYGHFSVHSWPNSPLLRVGNFCSIAVGVELILGGEHRHDAVSQYPYHMVFDRTSDSVDEDLTVRGPIHVGHDVWLSTNSVVLAGVTIGNGAVIAAESVVTRDVEPYAVVRSQRVATKKLAEVASRRWLDTANIQDERLEGDAHGYQYGRSSRRGGLAPP
jgi:acetyltransferase-like isoleucine patch superfamily enzyme